MAKSYDALSFFPSPAMAADAKLENVDEDSVNTIPGIVKVIHQGNFLAVLSMKRSSRVSFAASAQRRCQDARRRDRYLAARSHLAPEQ